MTETIEIDHALASGRLLGAGLGDIDTWRTWLVVLKAAFGRPLDKDELATFRTVAGNRAPPDHRVRELWAIAGRRSGKSRWRRRPPFTSDCSRGTGFHPARRGCVSCSLVRWIKPRSCSAMCAASSKHLPRWRVRSQGSSGSRSTFATASPSPCTATPTAPCAVAPWLPPSSMRWRSGAMNQPRRPMPKPTAPCCRAWRPRMACWSASRPRIESLACYTRSTAIISVSMTTAYWSCKARRRCSTPCWLTPPLRHSALPIRPRRVLSGTRNFAATSERFSTTN
jgi:hypothetical protein